MDWLNDLAARLPAPRVDEPPELRRRIVAELRDHLQAAYERELLLTADSVKAEQNVLDRFGDPARLARKLWFDAMWEKIMSQRLMIVALALVVVVSLGSMGLTWVLIDHARQANQALVEQSQKANDALLSKISALAMTNPPRSMEWNPIQVRVTSEKEGGKPVSGCQVILKGHLIDTSDRMSLDRKTDANGNADFGLVRPGQHSLDVTTPWNESMSRIVVVQPGESNIIKVVSPAPVEETEVTISVEWPQELANRRLWLICKLQRPSQAVDGVYWHMPGHRSQQIVAIDSDGKLMNFSPGTDGTDHNFFSLHSGHEFGKLGNRPGIYQLRLPQRTPPTFPTYVVMPVVAPASGFRWSGGTYSADCFCIARDLDRESETPANRLKLELVGGVILSGQKSVVHLNPNELGGFHRREDLQEDIREYVAIANQRNNWRIPIPQSLVTLLNEKPEPKPE
ncbi:MAG: carboxypeptidase regulatory-like domain-containing protein [Planctomycetia bacterium]|nr:carboxypeptidase regulatory-like domain-containing protein [Planctomycetia bacterium]